jgi:hypothetical protein
LQSWSELSDSVVAAGWEDGEKSDEDDESDSSDDRFELRMAMDADDKDVSFVDHAISEEEEDRDEPAFLADERISGLK